MATVVDMVDFEHLRRKRLIVKESTVTACMPAFDFGPAIELGATYVGWYRNILMMNLNTWLAPAGLQVVPVGNGLFDFCRKA